MRNCNKVNSTRKQDGFWRREFFYIHLPASFPLSHIVFQSILPRMSDGTLRIVRQNANQPLFFSVTQSSRSPWASSPIHPWRASTGMATVVSAQKIVAIMPLLVCALFPPVSPSLSLFLVQFRWIIFSPPSRDTGVLTREFLDFSASRGNTLRSIGLEPGCKWCLCTARWKEAADARKSDDDPVVPK